MEKIYDMIIIGGGPAGLAAAVAAGEAVRDAEGAAGTESAFSSTISYSSGFSQISTVRRAGA